MNRVNTKTLIRTSLHAVALSSAVLSCGLEELVAGEITRGGQVEMPKAAPNLLEGRVTQTLAGATVTFYTGAGDLLDSLASVADGAGIFTAEAPGNTGFTNLVVVARKGEEAAWGFVPEVERQLSVLDAARILDLRVLQPGLDQLDRTSTTVTLLLQAKARAAGNSLAVVPASTAKAAYTELVSLLGADARLQKLSAMVGSLDEAKTGVPALRFAPEGESWLDPAALAGGVDYTGDGQLDATTGPFDDALADALGAFEFNACYPPDQIRVVFIVDLRDGTTDRNCSVINRFRWAKDEAGKQVFITGAIHQDTPRCGEAPAPCLDGATIDLANQQLGNWTPNKVPLYDDGTHGDSAPGDGLWTLAVDMPYFEPAAADAPAVRLGYKYTYGFPGKGWTATEEWPGNKRILELRDQSGDRIITRQDAFGDETTNKDKANLLSPSKGGCGSIVFPSQKPKATCVNDVFEAELDTDGDCELDTWPKPGTASPLTVECAPQ